MSAEEAAANYIVLALTPQTDPPVWTIIDYSAELSRSRLTLYQGIKRQELFSKAGYLCGMLRRERRSLLKYKSVRFE